MPMSTADEANLCQAPSPMGNDGMARLWQTTSKRSSSFWELFAHAFGAQCKLWSGLRNSTSFWELFAHAFGVFFLFNLSSIC
jgi:hypothetical protein